MIVHDLNENLMCRCGHTWEQHHHGVVMNPLYADYPLTIRGCIAEECEYNQVNGGYFSRNDEKEYCGCNLFKPSSHNVQKLVDEWVKTHDHRR